jgi:eukaryotic-like serine/threonine-protein kinase
MPVSPLPYDAAVVGNYQLIRLLGEGGMGEVWLARHSATGAEVVVKRMRAERAGNPTVRRLFQAELRAMMRFRHPNAVALLDASAENDEQPFLVMEYLHGITLYEVLEAQGRITPEQIAPILGDVCVVLQAAHEQGIVHRDLTPTNLMIVNPGTERETVKVMDFGLARVGGFYIALERLQGDDGGIGGGTPDYVCPEQIRGEAVDGRGDLYSVGVLLYRALAGHLPFEEATEIQAILQAHREQTPPAFADYGVTDVPAAIEQVVQSCLAKLPAQRPPSARALAESFGQALGQPIVDPRAFTAPVPCPAEETRSFPPETLIDRFEAWMPEQIAAMKLRGFVQGVGGVVLESLPGLIHVRLASPQPHGTTSKGFWDWLRPAPLPAAAPSGELIELHLQKRLAGGASQVDVAVVRPNRAEESRAQREAGRERCRTVCRELRAYLMIGR